MGSLEQAIAKAKQYGDGTIPVANPPSNWQLPQPSAGICLQCGNRRHVLMAVKGSIHKICHSCIAMLQKAYGPNWEARVTNAVQMAIRDRDIKKQKLEARRASKLTK